MSITSTSRRPHVLINGFGRMGRLFLRATFDLYGPNVADHPFIIKHVNEIKGDAVTAAHLLEYDSLKGIWRTHKVQAHADRQSFTVNGHLITFSNAATIDDIPWLTEAGQVDMVVECTGKYLTKEALDRYFEHDVKKVVVSAPCKFDEAVNIHHVITNASCTTNCLAPVVKVIQEHIGIDRASFTTIHCVTNTQTIVDTAHKDLRRARSCMTSLVPTTTGSASAISLIFPELSGKIHGMAVRVPLLNASITDVVFQVSRDVTVDEVNRMLSEAAVEGPLKGILAVEGKPLVGEDFRGHTASGIVDLQCTAVTDKRLVKVVVWYDNEQGYCWRMAELAAKVARSM
ncbi:glyceraldehyde-3-phosphate dehydrogenase, type I [Catenaria anguillulae PL171]|uniref:Glyceraldehyde-3-phosphate dehydrogenase, type I n=1 Tax=Catenaria anguillulae PL171 TaxID=765915 RepID=A0A1Y2HWC4_9FUNG|nr:glyceraldehyde-3-phosphate dehydrogenase, type I [Catenaria anguillulae PL171]